MYISLAFIHLKVYNIVIRYGKTATPERQRNMTNAMIIFNNAVELMEQGIIGTTGRQITVENENGEKKTLDEPEAIHTYAAWKSLGFQVKKGEKAKASFMIWKYTTKKAKSEDEEEQSRMIMTKAFFFTKEQVETIEK